MKSLEAELRTLYSKVSELEQGKTKVELESSKKIEDLEEKVRKLEMENDHLNNSQDMLKKRHADEMKALESSHKYVSKSNFLYLMLLLAKLDTLRAEYLNHLIHSTLMALNFLSLCYLAALWYFQESYALEPFLA